MKEIFKNLNKNIVRKKIEGNFGAKLKYVGMENKMRTLIENILVKHCGKKKKFVPANPVGKLFYLDFKYEK